MGALAYKESAGPTLHESLFLLFGPCYTSKWSTQASILSKLAFHFASCKVSHLPFHYHIQQVMETTKIIKQDQKSLIFL